MQKIVKKLILYFLFFPMVLFGEEKISALNMDTYYISLVDLIVNGDKYHNKVVKVVGYMSKPSRGSGILYLSEKDLKNRLYLSTVSLNATKRHEELGNSYVVVTGRYDNNMIYFHGIRSGQITIDIIKKW